MGVSLPWNPWTHFPTALRELAKVATSLLVFCEVFDFIGKSSKSLHTPSYCLSSWANSRTSWGMLWCVLHHHGPQATHHNIPSKWCPSSSFLAHRVSFSCTTIVHFANGSVTWLHFECFVSLPWQIHLSGSLVKLPFEVLFLPHTPLKVGVSHLAHRALRSPSWACVGCPYWTMPMCLAISLVLMTTWVEWQNTSRSHCRSTLPHPWSLCNGPKSWDNVWWPTFPSHVLATFTPFCSASYSQMPLVFLALGLLQLQSRRHRNGSQNPRQSRVTSTLVLSPKCLSRSQRPRRMLLPIRKLQWTFSRGLSRVRLSSQSSWWTCDNTKPILKKDLKARTDLGGS